MVSLAHSFSSRLWPSSSAICMTQTADWQRKKRFNTNGSTKIRNPHGSRYFSFNLCQVLISAVYSNMFQSTSSLHTAASHRTKYPPWCHCLHKTPPIKVLVATIIWSPRSASVGGVYAGQTTVVGGNGHSRKKARLGWRFLDLPNRSCYLSCDMVNIYRNIISSHYYTCQ